MPITSNNLRCEVFWGAAEALRLLMQTNILLGEAEIRNTNMSLCIKQDIFWLEVSVNDFIFVKAPNRINYLSRVYFRTCLIKSLFFAEVGEKLSPIKKINNKI